MKKTLSIVLALVFVVAAVAAVALVPDSALNTDATKLVSIKVSDAAGYTNPYLAVDNAGAFVENQAAYVVVEMAVMGTDTTKYDYAATAHEVTITSSTLDLSYATATDKMQSNKAGTIVPATDPTGVFTGIAYSSTDVNLKFTFTPDGQPALKTDTNKFYYAFIAVTKPATAGEVKASMKVGATAFATSSSVGYYGATIPFLVVYDAAGVAKYTIYALGSNDYRVFSGKATSLVWAEISPKYLFDYVQTSTLFQYVGYSALPASATSLGEAVGFTYDGKLVYLGADLTLGTADDKDLTAAVNDCNAFFGFSFATSNPAVDKSFTDKTAGNPIVVTDTYAYVTATVETGDDVDIAPTGDFSANIIIVMAASAVLAAAALAFVAKKARD